MAKSDTAQESLLKRRLIESSVDALINRDGRFDPSARSDLQTMAQVALQVTSAGEIFPSPEQWFRETRDRFQFLRAWHVSPSGRRAMRNTDWSAV